MQWCHKAGLNLHSSKANFNLLNSCKCEYECRYKTLTLEVSASCSVSNKGQIRKHVALQWLRLWVTED